MVLVAIAASFVLGFLVVVVFISWQQALQLHRRSNVFLGPLWPHTSCPQVTGSVPRPVKLDRRLTGAGNIDEQLQKVVGYILRDYLEAWYHPRVSPDVTFLQQVRHGLHQVIIDVAKRCKEADHMLYFTQTLVDDCSNHLRLYKKALTQSADSSEIEKAFFEETSSTDPWATVCCNQEARQVYFQRVTELLLCMVLPTEEFQSPLLLQFLRDLLVWQVLLPLFHMLSQPDYLNSLLLALCKDSALTPESFTSALAESASESELTALGDRLRTEKGYLQKTGLTASDQQRLSALESLLGMVEQQQQHGSSLALHDVSEREDESLDEDGSSCPFQLSATIPKYSIAQEGRGKHAVYHIEVECRHYPVSVVEQWTALRKYSDFHSLHLTLQNLLGHLPAGMTFPSQRSFHRLDPKWLEARRMALQQYLQALVSEQFLGQYQQAREQLVLFLSGTVYRHNSNELTRMVDSLVQPFRRTTSILRTSDVPKKPHPPLPPPTESKVGDEDEDGLSLHVMLLVLDEVFDLRNPSQWLRRQLAALLKQLVGGKINRKIAETLEWFTSPEQVAEYIRDLSNTMWPGSYPVCTHPAPEASTQACRAAFARAKCIGSMPDDMRRFLGTERATKGMARLFGMLQIEALNCRLTLRLLEGLLDTLFQNRTLRDTCRRLRTDLSCAHNWGKLPH